MFAFCLAAVILSAGTANAFASTSVPSGWRPVLSSVVLDRAMSAELFERVSVPARMKNAVKAVVRDLERRQKVLSKRGEANSAVRFFELEQKARTQISQLIPNQSRQFMREVDALYSGQSRFVERVTTGRVRALVDDSGVSAEAAAYAPHARVYATWFTDKGSGYYCALPDKYLWQANGGTSHAGYPAGTYNATISYGGRSKSVPVLDVGPWNIDDNYWNTANDESRARRVAKDLARFLPEAQAAIDSGYNGGRAFYKNQLVGNEGGVDLSKALFDYLRLPDNDWVDVRFDWEPNLPGAVHFTAPVGDGGGFNAVGEIGLTANASDPDGPARIDFFRSYGSNGDVSVGYVPASSGTVTWDTSGSSVGSWRLRAKETDKFGGFSYGPYVYASVQKQARVQGADRYATAAAVSKKLFPAGASSIVLVRGDISADAAVAPPLAAYKHAPLLYALPTSLPLPTRNEIARLKPTTIYVIGSDSAINDDVVSQATAASGQTSCAADRMAGVNRYDTAKLARERMGKPGTVVLVRYDADADAISAAAGAAKNGYPILRCMQSSIPADTLNALRDGVTNVIVVGSTNTIDDTAFSQIPSGIAKTRVFGATRYDTNIALQSYFGLTGDEPYLVEGSGPAWSDGFAVASLCASGSDPLYLVCGDSMPAATGTRIDSMSHSTIWLVGSDKATPGYAW